MKTRKTKKRNIIRRAVAFLLCMTMVLGLGMQDVIDQVYAEETATQTLETQVADTEAAAEESAVPTGEETTPEETADPEETPAEENETEETTETPSGPAVDADADTGTEEGKKEQLSTPADSAESTTPADDAQNGSGSETSGETGTEEKTDSETQAPAEDGTVVTNPDETAGDEAEDDAAASDEEEETTEPEEKVTELTYEAEDGSFSVTAAAVGEDTDLSGYELHAARVLADGEDAGRYTAAKELIDGALEAESRKTEELQVYDVWFTNTENGEEADLSGQAELSINYTAPEFPEGTDVQMEVFCLNGGSAEAAEGTEALAAGSELYAVAWAVPAGYENVWENDQVIIRVTAEDGVVPEGAELSVTPIVKTEEEELANLPEEEKAKAEDINKQYDETEQKLNEELEAQNAEEMAALAAENASADVNMVSESGDTSDEAAGKKLEGFLAFDISFLVENENGEITEVEPSDKVNVSIEFKQATIPDEVSEDAEVSVAHLKEETNEAGETEIVVEDLTEADTTTVETTDKAEVTKVELVAEEFSIFTINWSIYSGYSKSLEIYVVDKNGTEIDGANAEMEVSSQETVYVDDILEQINAPGYTFSDTIKVGYSWKNAETKNIDAFKYYNWEIQYKVNSDKWWTELNTNYDEKVYFVYEKSDLTIADNISPDGLLEAVAGDELQEQLDQAEQQGEKVSYVWYKSENGQRFQEVEEIKSGSEYNIKNDGKALDIIIDGADKANGTKYKVVVFIGDDVKAESAEFEIPYYKEIQNKSFEIPKSDTNNIENQWSNEEYAQQNGVWQTTGLGSYSEKDGKDIEVLSVRKSYFSEDSGRGSGFMNGSDEEQKIAADGDQYAEINCETSGALYQDVLTDKKVDLNYYLSHRARSRDHGSEGRVSVEDKFDTMYLVIMPTNQAEEYKDHQALVGALNKLLEDNGKTGEIPYSSTKNQAKQEEAIILYNQNGVLIARITSDAADWHAIDSDHKIDLAFGVTSKTYRPTSALSRFFFISGATFAGDAKDVKGDTVGNLIDKIDFGQIPLLPDDGNVRITIQKTVTGLTQAELETLKDKLIFKITATNQYGKNEPNAPLVGEYSVKDLNWNITKEEDGTITATTSYTVEKEIGYSQEYVYCVEELYADMPKYDLTTSLNVKVTGETLSQDKTKATLGENDAAVFGFTNNYISSTAVLQFNKLESETDSPINNATFTLYEDENLTKEIGSAVSKNGVVEFEDPLTSGTYYLKETAVPEGYMPSAGVYTVEVKGGKAVVKDGNGEEIVNNTIYNTPVKDVLHYEKSAERADCDNRVYKINLSASTFGTTPGTKGDNASIVLLLDASSSLGGYFDDVQEAANSFIDTAASKVSGLNSGNIEIAVIWYQGSQNDNSQHTSSSGFKDVKYSYNVQELHDHVDEQEIDGGTPMGHGLQAAEELLKNAKYDNKYVVMFTDGRPGYWDPDNWRSLGLYSKNQAVWLNCMVANDAVNHADNIKDTDAIIYTVGFGDELSQKFRWREGDSDNSYNSGNHSCTDYYGYDQTSGADFLKNYIATSPDYYFYSETSDGLSDIFTDIAGSIGAGMTTYAEQIKDVIDSRFDLLIETQRNDPAVVWSKDGRYYRLAKNDDVVYAGEYAGTVSYDTQTKTYTIIWDKVTIPNSNANGWSASFYIKAKEDFIGGNVVPTNKPESGIYLTQDTVIKFPMPTVNVKLLDLSSSDKVDTYFKGEQVEPESFIRELFKTAVVKKLLPEQDTMSVSSIIGDLTDAQITNLLAGNNVEISYSYKDTNDIVGDFVLSLTNSDSWADHRLEEPGNGVEQYGLSIMFKAKEATERQESEWKEPICTPVDKEITVPTYKVNGVAGSILIKKTVSAEDLRKALESDETLTFTFKIKGENNRYNPQYDQDVMITFDQTDLARIPAGASEITKNAEVVTELAQDIYTVSEMSAQGFEASGIVAGGQSTAYPIEKVSVDEDKFTAQLSVGLPKEGISDENYLNYRDGFVTFTNSMVVSNWQIVKVSSSNQETILGGAEFKLVSSDGTNKYVGKSDEKTGALIWSKEDGSPVYYLNGGTYTLEETKAPDGYQLNEEEWTVVITQSGALDSITKENGTSITPSEGDGDKISYYYEDELLYDLPEAGGPGIYLYMLGGVALMMAGTLVVYKKRKGEVLRS